jgi:Undecaprenyl-phosphate glucose phosphotransferase
LTALRGASRKAIAHPLKARAPLPARWLGKAALLVHILAAAFVAAWGQSSTGVELLAAPFGAVLPFLIMPVAVHTGLKSARANDLASPRPILDHLLVAANATGLALVAALLASLAVAPREIMAAAATCAVLLWALVISLQAHILVFVRTLIRSGRLSENAVLVGATETARRLILENAARRDLNIVGIFDDRLSRSPSDLADVPVLGRIDDLLAWEHLPDIDCIIVTVSPDARERARLLIDRLRILPHRVSILLDYNGLKPEHGSLSEIAHSPAALVSGAPADLRRAAVKRLFDLVLSLMILVPALPVMALLALCVKLDSPGPVLFRQRRHGFNNEIINVWKFRSMHHDTHADNKPLTQTFRNDPRVTRVGAFIRRTSLDELPQIFNVIMGNMSLVGPRPHAINMTTEATAVHELVSGYAHRHRVKPGITGWAQINGSRGPVHTQEEVRERIRYDLEYVNRSNFWFDLQILLLTAPVLLGDRRCDR